MCRDLVHMLVLPSFQSAYAGSSSEAPLQQMVGAIWSEAYLYCNLDK